MVGKKIGSGKTVGWQKWMLVVLVVFVVLGFIFLSSRIFIERVNYGPSGTCYDSDNGQNYFLKGTINATYVNGLVRSWTDRCLNESDSNSKLVEYSCAGNPPSPMSNSVSCPMGYSCSNGGCVNESRPSCTNQCVGGTRRCNGNNGYQVCWDFNGDFCTEWSMTTLCSSDRVCADGQCVSNSLTCASFGYNNGTLGACCNANCTTYDLSNCYNQTRRCTDKDAYLGYPQFIYMSSNATFSMSTTYGPGCHNGGTGGGGGSILFDSCASNFTLSEAICTVEGYASTVDYTCQGSCLNGACVNNTLNVSRADLVPISLISVNDTFAENNTYSVKLLSVIKNVGGVYVNSTYTLFRIYPQMGKPEVDTYVFTPSLMPNQQATVSGTVTLQVGGYYISATADVFDAVVELDETNEFYTVIYVPAPVA